jgi:hypothetical protein
MATMTKLSQKLDAVSKARQAFVLARTTLEQRLREQMREELNSLQTQIDIAVRYAYDSGESKASILRAMGTKNFGTLTESLERTQGITEVVGADPLADVYILNDYGYLVVNYVNHGVNNANGSAVFEFRKLDDGRTLFTADTSLWNDDYTVRNDAVAFLDGKTDGFYYEEAVAWVQAQ